MRAEEPLVVCLAPLTKAILERLLCLQQLGQTQRCWQSLCQGLNAFVADNSADFPGR